MNEEKTLTEMTIGELADLSVELRNQSREFERKKKDLDAQRKSIEGIIISKMGEADVTQMATGNASLTVGEKKVANPADWDDIYEYIKENDAFYLIQRRLSSKAIVELIEDGNEVPGVTLYTEPTLSIRAK